MDVLGRVLLALIQRDTCLVGSCGAPTQRKASALQGTGKWMCAPSRGLQKAGHPLSRTDRPHLAVIL